MVPDIQDKALYKIYENLPLLQYVHPFIGFGAVLPVPVVIVTFIPSIKAGIINLPGQHSPRCVCSSPMTRKSLSVAESRCLLLNVVFHRLLLRGLRFVQAGDYVNMSRINPTALTLDSTGSGVIKIAGTRHSAVGIMMGIVTECNIINPGLAGPFNAPYAVRRITIAPFAQEFRRDTSVWGAILKFRSITAVVGGGGISFMTRRKVEIPQGGETTPKKNAAYLTQVTSPLASSSAGRSGASYPPSRGFDDPSVSYLQMCSLLN
jgi:hypothetical protein